MQLCDDMWRKGWWDPYAGDVDKDFINNPWLESGALRVCTYQNMIIHGLPQTEEYARTVIRFEMPEPYPEVGYVETIGGGLYVETPGAERFHDTYDSLTWSDIRND